LLLFFLLLSSSSSSSTPEMSCSRATSTFEYFNATKRCRGAHVTETRRRRWSRKPKKSGPLRHFSTHKYLVQKNFVSLFRLLSDALFCSLQICDARRRDATRDSRLCTKLPPPPPPPRESGAGGERENCRVFSSRFRSRTKFSKKNCFPFPANPRFRLIRTSG
jgi:hypothetical protein